MNISDTKGKILEAGKQEFLKCGFKDASLRNIAAKAGFTKGAFYGYYPDKAALFYAIVSEAAEGLIRKFKTAQSAHFELIDKDKTSESWELSAQYLRYFLDYIYEHFYEFKLIICCSEGTKYSNYIHDLVELEVDCAKKYYEMLRERGKLKGNISAELHHMITSAYFTAVFETVVHDMDKNKAMEYIKELTIFFNSGWLGLLKFI